MSDELSEEELDKMRRWASIGRGVTGVVHESRNILTGVLSFAQIGKRKASRSSDDESAELFGRIETELLRVLEIFGHTLDVARESRPSKPPRLISVDLAPPLRSVRALIREQARNAKVSVDVQMPEELPRVIAFERYIVQILLNLCINAIDATPSGGTVQIKIETDDEWVDVHVVDDGEGVASESQDKIFEPFFTTKETGTGLGLSESRKMALELGGDLVLLPRVGSGAAFMLRLRKVDA